MMMRAFLRQLSVLWAALALLPVAAHADCPVDIDLSADALLGTSGFAPYYIASNNHGLITQSHTALIDAGISSHRQVNSRLAYAWALEGILDVSSRVGYARYDAASDSWSVIGRRPPLAWLQQLYGRVDYRSLFLWAGMRQGGSALLDNRLSSGDLVEGCNARPIPQVRVGFNDFQPVPFTSGWVEIQGEISYGKMTDDGWLTTHANRYDNHVCLGSFYTYKRCYLRTKSSRPLHLTVGMQVAAFFGGTTTVYEGGAIDEVIHHKSGIKEFIKMIIPTGGDEDYYMGSILGSWDIMATYRAPWGGTFKGYLQKPWETGSGIGFLNGFDGLWGLEYRAPRRGWLDGLVVEYIDFTNQSGPIHFDPTDLPGCLIPTHTDGGDDYYNNYTYNSYANYGMSLGTPFLRSPLYNTDGWMSYVDNVVRGFHIGAEGTLSPRLTYRALGGYRKGWGAIRLPRARAVDDTSWMLEATWHPLRDIDRYSVSARVAMDRGSMYGDTFGVMLTLRAHLDTNLYNRK